MNSDHSFIMVEDDEEENFVASPVYDYEEQININKNNNNNIITTTQNNKLDDNDENNRNLDNNNHNNEIIDLMDETDEKVNESILDSSFSTTADSSFLTNTNSDDTANNNNSTTDAIVIDENTQPPVNIDPPPVLLTKRRRNNDLRKKFQINSNNNYADSHYNLTESPPAKRFSHSRDVNITTNNPAAYKRIFKKSSLAHNDENDNQDLMTDDDYEKSSDVNIISNENSTIVPNSELQAKELNQFGILFQRSGIRVKPQRSAEVLQFHLDRSKQRSRRNQSNFSQTTEPIKSVLSLNLVTETPQHDDISHYDSKRSKFASPIYSDTDNDRSLYLRDIRLPRSFSSKTRLLPIIQVTSDFHSKQGIIQIFGIRCTPTNFPIKLNNLLEKAFNCLCFVSKMRIEEINSWANISDTIYNNMKQVKLFMKYLNFYAETHFPSLKEQEQQHFVLTLDKHFAILTQQLHRNHYNFSEYFQSNSDELSETIIKFSAELLEFELEIHCWILYFYPLLIGNKNYMTSFKPNNDDPFFFRFNIVYYLNSLLDDLISLNYFYPNIGLVKPNLIHRSNHLEYCVQPIMFIWQLLKTLVEQLFELKQIFIPIHLAKLKPFHSTEFEINSTTSHSIHFPRDELLISLINSNYSLGVVSIDFPWRFQDLIRSGFDRFLFQRSDLYDGFTLLERYSQIQFDFRRLDFNSISFQSCIGPINNFSYRSEVCWEILSNIVAPMDTLILPKSLTVHKLIHFQSPNSAIVEENEFLSCHCSPDWPLVHRLIDCTLSYLQVDNGKILNHYAKLVLDRTLNLCHLWPLNGSNYLFYYLYNSPLTIFQSKIPNKFFELSPAFTQLKGENNLNLLNENYDSTWTRFLRIISIQWRLLAGERVNCMHNNHTNHYYPFDMSLSFPYQCAPINETNFDLVNSPLNRVNTYLSFMEQQRNFLVLLLNQYFRPLEDEKLKNIVIHDEIDLPKPIFVWAANTGWIAKSAGIAHNTIYSPSDASLASVSSVAIENQTNQRASTSNVNASSVIRAIELLLTAVSCISPENSLFPEIMKIFYKFKQILNYRDSGFKAKHLYIDCLAFILVKLQYLQHDYQEENKILSNTSAALIREINEKFEEQIRFYCEMEEQLETIKINEKRIMKSHTTTSVYYPAAANSNNSNPSSSNTANRSAANVAFMNAFGNQTDLRNSIEGLNRAEKQRQDTEQLQFYQVIGNQLTQIRLKNKKFIDYIRNKIQVIMTNQNSQWTVGEYSFLSPSISLVLQYNQRFDSSQRYDIMMLLRSMIPDKKMSWSNIIENKTEKTDDSKNVVNSTNNNPVDNTSSDRPNSQEFWMEIELDAEKLRNNLPSDNPTSNNVPAKIVDPVARFHSEYSVHFARLIHQSFRQFCVVTSLESLITKFYDPTTVEFRYIYGMKTEQIIAIQQAKQLYWGTIQDPQHIDKVYTYSSDLVRAAAVPLYAKLVPFSIEYKYRDWKYFIDLFGLNSQFLQLKSLLRPSFTMDKNLSAAFSSNLLQWEIDPRFPHNTEKFYLCQRFWTFLFSPKTLMNSTALNIGNSGTANILSVLNVWLVSMFNRKVLEQHFFTQNLLRFECFSQFFAVPIPVQWLQNVSEFIRYRSIILYSFGLGVQCIYPSFINNYRSVAELTKLKEEFSLLFKGLAESIAVQFIEDQRNFDDKSIDLLYENLGILIETCAEPMQGYFLQFVKCFYMLIKAENRTGAQTLAPNQLVEREKQIKLYVYINKIISLSIPLILPKMSYFKYFNPTLNLFPTDISINCVEVLANYLNQFLFQLKYFNSTVNLYDKEYKNPHEQEQKLEKDIVNEFTEAIKCSQTKQPHFIKLDDKDLLKIPDFCQFRAKLLLVKTENNQSNQQKLLDNEHELRCFLFQSCFCYFLNEAIKSPDCSFLINRADGILQIVQGYFVNSTEIRRDAEFKNLIPALIELATNNTVNTYKSDSFMYLSISSIRLKILIYQLLNHFIPKSTSTNTTDSEKKTNSKKNKPAMKFILGENPYVYDVLRLLADSIHRDILLIVNNIHNTKSKHVAINSLEILVLQQRTELKTKYFPSSQVIGVDQYIRVTKTMSDNLDQLLLQEAQRKARQTENKTRSNNANNNQNLSNITHQANNRYITSKDIAAMVKGVINQPPSSSNVNLSDLLLDKSYITLLIPHGRFWLKIQFCFVAVAVKFLFALYFPHRQAGDPQLMFLNSVFSPDLFFAILTSVRENLVSTPKLPQSIHKAYMTYLERLQLPDDLFKQYSFILPQPSNAKEKQQLKATEASLTTTTSTVKME